MTATKKGRCANTDPNVRTQPHERNQLIMSINANTAVSTGQDLVSTWCEQVRDIHAEESQPIHAGDPRMTKLSAANPEWAPESGYDAETLGWLYFTNVSTIPEFPASAPDWAVRTEIRRGAYPEIDIEYYGQDWNSGEFTASLRLSWSISVEDVASVDVDPMATPVIDVNLGEPVGFLSAEDARNLSIVLKAAAHEFTDRIGEVGK